MDEQLSEFERRLVAAHVERCDDCRAYHADVVAFTRALREARLDCPERQIVVRRPRRVHATRAGLRAAALALPVVVAVVVGQGAVSRLGEQTVALATPTHYPTSQQLSREVTSVLDARPASLNVGVRGQQQPI